MTVYFCFARFSAFPSVLERVDEPLISIVALRTDDRVVRSTRFAGGGSSCFGRTPSTSGRRIICQCVADQIGQSDGLGAGWSIREHRRFCRRADEPMLAGRGRPFALNGLRSPRARIQLERLRVFRASAKDDGRTEARTKCAVKDAWGFRRLAAGSIKVHRNSTNRVATTYSTIRALLSSLKPRTRSGAFPGASQRWPR